MKQIIVIIAIVLVFLFWKKKSNSQDPSIDLVQEGQIQDSVIQMGSKGIDVRRLQMKLNELVSKAVNQEIPIGYSLDGVNYFFISQPLVVDGIFGRATETMLYALTGRKSVKASEIDDLFIAPSA